MKIIEKMINLWYYVFAKGKREKNETTKNEKENREDDDMNAIELSNYIIAKFNDQNATITNLKLQKVLYYIQGYSLKFFGKPAFQEEIYCWQYGPVVPMSYYEYNISGAHQLRPSGIVGEPGLELKNLVDCIVDACRKIPSSVLVAKTHSEGPWKYAGIGEIIPIRQIQLYFTRNNPLELKV